jgi:hypothetical protein
MSVRTMAAVWERSSHAGTELLMLLAIADFADDGGNAYPAVATLASKCRMTARNANLILAALRASGELEVRPNEGPKGTNRYRVLPAGGLKAASPLKRASPLKPASSTPEAGFPKPLKPASDEPSLNHHEPAKADAFDAASASDVLSAKDRAWSLGPAILGAKAKPLLGKLAKTYGDETLAEVLAEAQAQLPLHDPKAWVVAACEAKMKARGSAAGRQSMFDRDPSPGWLAGTGFATIWDAESAGCNQGNAKRFRGGRRAA